MHSDDNHVRSGENCDVEYFRVNLAIPREVANRSPFLLVWKIRGSVEASRPSSPLSACCRHPQVEKLGNREPPSWQTELLRINDYPANLPEFSDWSLSKCPPASARHECCEVSYLCNSNWSDCLSVTRDDQLDIYVRYLTPFVPSRDAGFNQISHFTHLIVIVTYIH